MKKLLFLIFALAGTLQARETAMERYREMLLKKAEGRLAWSVWANVEGAELIRHTKEIYRQVREWVILQPLSYEMIFLATSP